MLNYRLWPKCCAAINAVGDTRLRTARYLIRDCALTSHQTLPRDAMHKRGLCRRIGVCGPPVMSATGPLKMQENGEPKTMKVWKMRYWKCRTKCQGWKFVQQWSMPNPDIGQKSRFLHLLREPRRNIAIKFGMVKLQCGLPDGEKKLKICLAQNTQTWRTDRRTPHDGMAALMHNIARQKITAGNIGRSNEIHEIKKLSCCRESRCSVSLKILLSLKAIQGHLNLHRWVGPVYVFISIPF